MFKHRTFIKAYFSSQVPHRILKVIFHKDIYMGGIVYFD